VDYDRELRGFMTCGFAATGCFAHETAGQEDQSSPVVATQPLSVVFEADPRYSLGSFQMVLEVSGSVCLSRPFSSFILLTQMGLGVS